jgi:streptomycin 6-kinase
VHERSADLARRWHVTVEQTFETPTSVISYGLRDRQPVVLKVVKQPCDEWRSGEVVHAFDGRGVVRAYEYVDGALLLERLDPGDPLVDLTIAGHDDEATAILADVIAAMSPGQAPAATPTVSDWAAGFARYRGSGNDQVPRDLVACAEQMFVGLCASQREPRLLHGDLQHYNVLRDRTRGWVAIDPKGVVGELEYDIGAMLRNPVDRPDMFAARATIERRLAHFAGRLGLDVDRMLRWGFAQAVLSAIWDVEDGYRVDATHPSLKLAAAIEPMLG